MTNTYDDDFLGQRLDDAPKPPKPRWVIRSHSGFWIFALQPMTTPAWTDEPRKAKTWASKEGARRAARRHGLHLHAVDFVQVGN